MVTSNGRVKCDICGRFIKVNKMVNGYQPDSAFTAERSEQYHKECFVKIQPGNLVEFKLFR